MKKLTITFAAILILGNIFVSCKKTTNYSNSTSKNEVIENLKADDVPPFKFKMHCSGECANGSNCFITGGPDGSVECNCEGCVMEFIIDGKTTSGLNPKNSTLLKYISKRDLFLKHLDNFVSNKFNTLQYGITMLWFEFLENDSYYVQYDILTDDNQKESVLYLYQSGATDEAKKFEFDCAGPCDNPEETCRERYVFNPPSVECTCEGACTMTMIEL